MFAFAGSVNFKSEIMRHILASLAVLVAMPGMSANKQTTQLVVKEPANYVNPFVGTDGFGNVYPGAQLPFGGIQISPDTDEHYYDCASGYKWNRNSIQGFSLTHLSGTGIPDLGDFLFMPGVGEPMLEPGTDDKPTLATAHASLMTRRLLCLATTPCS